MYNMIMNVCFTLTRYSTTTQYVFSAKFFHQDNQGYRVAPLLPSISKIFRLDRNYDIIHKIQCNQ